MTSFHLALGLGLVTLNFQLRTFREILSSSTLKM
jgi:hypothetical protein